MYFSFLTDFISPVSGNDEYIKVKSNEYYHPIYKTRSGHWPKNYYPLWFYGEYHIFYLMAFFVRFMVFSAIFNNISVISRRSALLAEETAVEGEIANLPLVTDILYHIMLYREHLA